MKNILKYLLSMTPYRVVRRTQINRFQAVDEALKSLAARGYGPRVVIDCGANTGAFARAALSFFPGAIVHAVEPQPGCQESLEFLRDRSRGRVIVHGIALCAPENDGQQLYMATDVSATFTGAHVAPDGTGLNVPCRTLDSALSPYADAIDGALLKLDLQGYELHALRGAKETLRRTDVILTEVSFYAQAYEPPISELVEFLARAGFELYDIAAIFARPRDDRPRQADFMFLRSSAKLAQDTSWS